MNIKLRIIIKLLAFGIVGFSLGVRAATPVITSFTVSPTAISSGYAVSLSWTLSDATGVDVLFTCPVGVILKKPDGTSFPCGSRVTLPGSPLGDNTGFNVINVSGVTQGVLVKLYPKDVGGQSIDANVQTASFNVTTSPQPLTSISVASTTVLSGSPSIFSWVGHDISNVNVIFDCNQNLTLYAGTNLTAKPLLCNQNAYFADLLATDTTVITAINNSPNQVTLNAKVIPTIGNGSYDQTHALSISTVIGPKIDAAQPIVTDFHTDQSSLYSGIPFSLIWSTANTTGANIQFQCNANDLSLQLLDGTTTTKGVCGTSLFPTNLSMSGSTTVSIINNTPYVQVVPVLLLPQIASSTYLATIAKTILLTIPVAGTVPSLTSGTSVVSATSSIAISTSTVSVLAISLKTNLRRGSYGKDVTLLQQFLSQNRTAYPTISLTGYYGAGTETAVKKFQLTYSITKKGSVGYGSVGPATRARINGFTGMP